MTLVRVASRRVGLIGFSDPLRAELLASLPPERLMDGMHLWVLRADGPPIIRTGGEAAVALLALSRVGSALLRVPMVSALVGGTYRLVARHRRRLGRLLPAVDAVRRLPLGPDGLRSSPLRS